jgi:hypothetical protein
MNSAFHTDERAPLSGSGMLVLTLMSGIVLGVCLAIGAGANDASRAMPPTPAMRASAGPEVPLRSDAVQSAPKPPADAPATRATHAPWSHDSLWVVAATEEQAQLAQLILQDIRGHDTAHVFLITTPEEQTQFDHLHKVAVGESMELLAHGDSHTLQVIDLR